MLHCYFKKMELNNNLITKKSSMLAVNTQIQQQLTELERREWFDAFAQQVGNLPPSPFPNLKDPGQDPGGRYDAYIKALKDVIIKAESAKKTSSGGPSMAAVLKTRLGALLCADIFYPSQLDQPVSGISGEVINVLQDTLLELRRVRSEPGWSRLYASASNELATALDSIGRYDDAEEVYNDLLAAVPDSEHIVDFAFFIHKRYKNLKSMYSGDVKALNGVSAAAETVGINFAQERIDRIYRMALESFPNKASLNFKYATFLRHCRIPIKLPLPGLVLDTRNHNKNPPGKEETISALDAADLYYSRSISLDPTLSEAFASYASFLYATRRFSDGGKGSDVGNATTETVERLFMKAVELDPANMSALCNWGLFLSEEKRSFAKAEHIYKRALAVHPKHVNTLYNYAVLLDTHNPPHPVADNAVIAQPQSNRMGNAVSVGNSGGVSRRAEAAALYARAIAENPTHSYALYNLAVLKEDEARSIGTLIPHDYNSGGSRAAEGAIAEIAALYERAASSDLNDADLAADLGRFFLVYKGDLERAGVALQRSLECSEHHHEIALYNAAVLKYSHVNDSVGAVDLLRTLLLEVNPHHSVSAWQLLGRALLDAHLIYSGSGASKSSSNRSQIDKLAGKSDIFKNETSTDSVIGLLKTLSGGNRSLSLIDCAQEALEKAIRMSDSNSEKEALLAEYLRMPLRVPGGDVTQKAKARAVAFAERCVPESRGNGDILNLISQLKS